MDTPYPAGPSSVPANLTAPTASYRRNAWLALIGLLGFVAFYLALLGWFAWTAFRLLGGLAVSTGMMSLPSGMLGSVFAQGGQNPVAAALIGGSAAFLAVFMAKALIFVKRGSVSDDIELKPAEQPRLFAFLHRLADEAGAPRPRRVYVSPRVNAAVFYDLSIANLVFPSHKNLEIGLALVNVLDLGEFKAVLAHEFGHFAQRTMAVGRWVYIAHQIAAHVIARRDAFDRFLRGLSGVDLRVAWVGWVLRLIVWSIRSLVELIFRGVLLADRALSREMEYQADLVAVSLTGSDALVHALHKLGAADDAWDRAIRFAGSEMGEKRRVRDLFAIQTRILEKMRTILADPQHGVAPALPPMQREAHRVFKSEMAQPPQMWSTHPANADRERNVKRHYVAAPGDTRPAWLLFDGADALRETMSARIFTGELPPVVDIGDSLRRLDAHYDRPSLDRRYRGSFLGRSAVRHAASVDGLYSSIQSSEDLAARIATLYDDDHDRDLDRLRDLEREKHTLAALHAGRLTAAGGVVRWRGRELSRRELPRVIADVDNELAEVQRAVTAHDCRCRSLHLAAAQRLGNGWEAYLRGLAAILHYADHAQADLRDAQGFLANTYSVVTADGNVSGGELKRLVQACNVVQSTLSAIHHAAPNVAPGPDLLAKLGIAHWAEALGELKLPRADEQNINQWLGAADSWINAASHLLGELAAGALEQLLSGEDRVARALAQDSIEAAPQPSRLDAQYVTLVPGSERKRQDRLGWWDRFQTAEGWVPSIARFAVAGGIVGSVLLLGGAAGHAAVSIYNGLARPVRVSIDGVARVLPPHGSATFDLALTDAHRVEAYSEDGRLIESFQTDGRESGSHFVYNVAGAAVLYRWTAVYGNVAAVPPQTLGTQRWSSTDAQHVFSEPPATISSKSGGGSRSALGALSGENAGLMLSEATADARPALIRTHAVWDAADSPRVGEWLSAVRQLPDAEAVIAARLRHDPHEVMALRAEQDLSEGDAHREVCTRHEQLAAAAQDSGDLHYVALRCAESSTAKDAALMAAAGRWPDNLWIANAVAYSHAEHARWNAASRLLERVVAGLPPMREAAALELARVARAVGGADAAKMATLAKQSQYVAMVVSLETGDGLAPDAKEMAYVKLYRGELDAAVAMTPDDVALVQMVAASEGATRAQIDRAFALPVEKPSDIGAWPLLALAMREGRDTTPQLEQARGTLSAAVGERIVAFLQSLRAGAGEAEADAVLGALGTRERGIAYASAVTLLQERCPQAWRRSAQGLLFGYERPYFR